MPKATVFEFTSYTFEPDKNRAVFHYTTKFENGAPIIWTETINLPKAPTQDIPTKLTQKLLESLHVILGISYYKFHCAKGITLPYQLPKPEADFWNTVYKKGLGEFFYRNKLNPNISPKFPHSNSARPKPYSPVSPAGRLNPNPSRCLVGIGGGKDSIVSTELLKEHGFDATAFVVETNQSSELIENIINISGLKSLKIQRQLDPQVFEAHPYNGHIPISAIYAFLGIFASALHGYDYFIVSNEHSSNFGNTTYKGLDINHQWSKSFEFEKLFQEFVKNFLTPGIIYFSLLRPCYEIRIVKMFARLKKYFPYFSSCNRNFVMQGKTHGGLWCGQCPKCVFAFTLLSAFVTKKELLGIFGKNLYEDQSLLPLFKDILGLGTIKPFDCVGTFEEARTALAIARKKFSSDFIVRQLGKQAKYHPEVFKTNKEAAIPEQFRFLGIERVLILGYGKEGKITKQYLKKYYPKLKVGVGDEATDKKYLKKQADFDMAIKTPGIKKELVTIPYTTATNIFFSKVLPNHTTIGVTGSKGKSTTASLISHILKTAGKEVEFLGNIGKPMLEALLKPIKKDTIFVLELSSYQLDDIKFVPHIAVLTNLFPEHMDYHGTLQNYYHAKKHVIEPETPFFVTPGNKVPGLEKKDVSGQDGIAEYFIYNPKNLIMRRWLKEYQGEAVPFSKKAYHNNLLGEHNQSNIGAAAAVASILEISESDIQKAVGSFVGLEHRLEKVGEFNHITFYNDAISTTPDSTIMAIKALRGIDTIFLGGQDRGYHFSQLEKVIKKYKIKNIVLFPDSGQKMFKSLKGLNVLNTKSMAEAVKFAYQHTGKGKICLLSCASPSYSLWKNFEEKGDQFKSFVKKLSKP